MVSEKEPNLSVGRLQKELPSSFLSDDASLFDLAEEMEIGEIVLFRIKPETGVSEVLGASREISASEADEILRARDKRCCAIVCSPDKRFNVCFLSETCAEYAIASRAFWILYAAQSQKEAKWVTKLLDGISLPLSTEGSLEQYANRLCEATCVALDGRYVVIRQSTESGSYTALGVYDSEGDLSDVSFLPTILPGTSLHDCFSETLSSCSGGRILRLSIEKNPDVFSEVLSLVGVVGVASTYTVPLTVGGADIGFLSIAFREDKKFSELEETAVLSVGNHIAAAVDAFIANEEASFLREMKLREFIENINAELIHGFRHAARNSLHSARLQFSRLERRSGKFDTQSQEIIREVRQDLDETSHAIENMGNLKSFNNEDYEMGRIEDVFDDAIKMIENWEVYKDSSVQIRKSLSKTGLIRMQRTSLVYAFANLVLNSLQSFGELSGGNRRNEINFSAVLQGSRIVVRYADNGPGLRIGRGDIMSVEDIWLPGKTSKKEGTGYGLPMVREVIQRLHGGSIDLKQSRGGMLFEIVFPV